MKRTLIICLSILYFMLIPFLGFTQNTFAKSKIRKEIKEIIEKIEKINMLQGSAVGYSASRPEQYDHFMTLKDKATIEELTELTRHKNGVVRGYAFWALTDKDHVDLWPFIIDHISDDEEMKVQFGCTIDTERVGDFYINMAKSKLDSSQLQRLDHILIFEPNHLDATSEAIKRSETHKDLYLRIRDLAIKEKNQEAVVALAKYQKEQDIHIILNNRGGTDPWDEGLFFTYRAISYFPHPEFLPFLEKNLKVAMEAEGFRNEWYELYNAIARYQNNEAKRLLEIPFREIRYDTSRPYQMNFIFQAIRQNRAKIYDHLLWKLWAEENKISLNILEYLLSKDPSRANDLIKKNLRNEDLVLNNHFENEVIERMLERVLEEDRAYGLEVIRININKADVHLFPIFAKKAKEIQDQSFVDPLFNRLEREQNPYIYLEAAKALLAYKDNAINQRILQTRERNDHLKKDWGGAAFEGLLEEHHLEWTDKKDGREEG